MSSTFSDLYGLCQYFYTGRQIDINRGYNFQLCAFTFMSHQTYIACAEKTFSGPQDSDMLQHCVEV